MSYHTVHPSHLWSPFQPHISHLIPTSHPSHETNHSSLILPRVHQSNNTSSSRSTNTFITPVHSTLLQLNKDHYNWCFISQVTWFIVVFCLPLLVDPRGSVWHSLFPLMHVALVNIWICHVCRIRKQSTAFTNLFHNWSPVLLFNLILFFLYFFIILF